MILLTIPVKALLQLKPTLEIRERFERRTDKDFSEVKKDNRSDLNSRWRFGVDFNYGKKISGKVVYQFSSDAYWTSAKNAAKVTSDLLYGYADFNLKVGTLRAGRQPLSKGAERLLEKGEWGNTTRSWDMVRWTGGKWDGWFGRLAVNSIQSADALLGGLSYQSSLGETMGLFKHDKRNDGPQDDIYTLDHRWKRQIGKLAWEIEGAVQAGRVGDNKLEAWAAETKGVYQTTKKLAIFGELDAASGGMRGNTVLTFDQMYPGNHSKYGIMDMQGWRNMKGINLGLNYKPNPKLSINFEYWRFNLFAADDAWYGDNGRPNRGGGGTFLDSTGSSGRDLGEEFDLSGSLVIDARSTFDAGVGIFKPGKFVDAFANTGDKNQLWGFLQYKYKF
jgi:hypothetical protein